MQRSPAGLSWAPGQGTLLVSLSGKVEWGHPGQAACSRGSPGSSAQDRSSLQEWHLESGTYSSHYSLRVYSLYLLKLGLISQKANVILN